VAKRYVRPVESRQFLIRRLHSLSGIIPVGVFLFFHIGTNSLIAVSGPADDLYQKQVNNIHNLGPLLIPVEILFIFVPLAYHAIVGTKIWLESRPNAKNYTYWGNIRYTLQRTTGVATLVFILLHLYQMHWLGAWLPGGGGFHHADASLTTAQVLQKARWIAPVYMIGVTCACFHLANGTWTFLITWGVTIGPRSQRIAGYACAAMGVALAITGLIAVRGFTVFDTRHDKPMIGHPGGDSAQRAPDTSWRLPAAA
jgi:succinate dehydrogenase / fumarate reductase cytochrome b subunit